MDELRKQVERIVRPIRANVRRKNKMRQELLAHLSERAHMAARDGLDEREAYDLAVEQLGDPAALRRELQETVPVIERLMYLRLPWAEIADHWFDKADGESTLGFTLRRTAYTSLFVGITLVVFLTAFELLRWAGILPEGLLTRVHPPGRAFVVLSLFGIQVLATGLAYLLADVTGVRRVLSRRNGSGVWRKTGALWLFMGEYLFLFLVPSILLVSAFQPEVGLAILRNMISEGGLRELAVCSVLAFCVAFPCVGLIMKWEHKQYKKWGQLEIDD